MMCLSLLYLCMHHQCHCLVIRGHVSRKGTRPLFIKARQEREMLQAFVGIISESSARIGASLSSHCRQDAERPAPSMFDEHGAEPMSTFDLPPPPSTHELEANLVAVGANVIMCAFLPNTFTM